MHVKTVQIVFKKIKYAASRNVIIGVQFIKVESVINGEGGGWDKKQNSDV